MKRFCGTLAVTLVFVEAFLFCGGHQLFDFSQNVYGAGAACAFLIALILHGFAVQADRIESLEKRIRDLEGKEADRETGRAETGKAEK